MCHMLNVNMCGGVNFMRRMDNMDKRCLIKNTLSKMLNGQLRQLFIYTMGMMWWHCYMGAQTLSLSLIYLAPRWLMSWQSWLQCRDKLPAFVDQFLSRSSNAIHNWARHAIDTDWLFMAANLSNIAQVFRKHNMSIFFLRGKPLSLNVTCNCWLQDV